MKTLNTLLLLLSIFLSHVSFSLTKVTNEKFLRLMTNMPNGIGDLIHLEEIIKILRNKYPTLNLVLHLEMRKEAMDPFKEMALTNFIHNSTKLLVGKNSKLKYCSGIFIFEGYSNKFQELFQKT